MNRHTTILAAIAIPALMAACACGDAGTPVGATQAPANSGAASTQQAHAATSAITTATLAIEGMTCASCSVTVKVAAGKLDGVDSVDVDVDAGRATVRFDSSKVDAQQIADRITDAGYKTTVVSTQGA